MIDESCENVVGWTDGWCWCLLFSFTFVVIAVTMNAHRICASHQNAQLWKLRAHTRLQKLHYNFFLIDRQVLCVSVQSNHHYYCYNIIVVVYIEIIFFSDIYKDNKFVIIIFVASLLVVLKISLGGIQHIAFNYDKHFFVNMLFLLYTIGNRFNMSKGVAASSSNTH